jgi:hypothetical protein
VFFYRKEKFSAPFKNVIIFGFLTHEDVTDRLSRNVGKKLPLLAAQYRRRAQFSNVISSMYLKFTLHKFKTASLATA